MNDQKINLSFLQNYSKQVSEVLMENFFKGNRDFISGNEILQVSPIQQLNLIILKNIFEQWKVQLQKSKSVFFDYKHPDVVKAQQNFHNILSNHIKIDQDNFSTLIKHSTEQCLNLLLKPWDFIKNEFSTTERIPREVFNDKLRYFKLYPEIINKITETAEKNIKFPATQNEILTFIHELEKNIKPDSLILNKTLQQFHTLVPVLNEISKTTPEISTVVSTPEQKISPSPLTPPDQKESLNDSFKSDKTSLSQQYVEKTKSNDLHKLINLNKKYYFINQLFNGNTDDYEKNLNQLNQCATIDSAKKMVNEEIIVRYKISRESKPLEEFLEIVEQKFSVESEV